MGARLPPVQAFANTGMESDKSKWLDIVRGLLLVAFALPNHFIFFQWLWTQVRAVVERWRLFGVHDIMS